MVYGESFGTSRNTLGQLSWVDSHISMADVQVPGTILTFKRLSLMVSVGHLYNPCTNR